MVATLVGVTLAAGITSAAIVSGADSETTSAVSEAALAVPLERVGEVPPVPPTVVAGEVGPDVPVTTAAAPPGPARAVAPSATTTTAVVAGAPVVAPPPGVVAPAPTPPTTKPVLALPAIDLAPLLPGPTASAARAPTGRSDTGVASWFGARAGTCAHRTLPFGTAVRVTRLLTGAVATCTVDDRGPTLETGRLIDLSDDTFAELASTDVGLIEVRIEW